MAKLAKPASTSNALVDYWIPQEGPQSEAFSSPVDEIFFGGERGGGKSDCTIGRQIYGALTYGPAWNGLILRRKYKEFKELRRRWSEIIVNSGLPAQLIGGAEMPNEIRFSNGATISMIAINRLELVDDFIGHQFTEISIEEGPQIPFIARAIDKLRGSLRSPHGVATTLFITGNPGGAGSSQIKEMYIDPIMGGGANNPPEGTIGYNTLDLPDGGSTTLSRIFIKSGLKDNRILCDNDPKYVGQLRAIKDEALRAAWLEGRWDVFIGQAFNFTDRHVLLGDAQVPVPEHVPIYMTFDWGYGAPFSVGWWWVDNDDRIYRFAEWYGWDGVTPDVGLHLTDRRIAQGIMEREAKLGIADRSIERICGPDSQNKKPDYKGGGQGPSTMEEFDKFGREQSPPYDLSMRPGDPIRHLKIRQFRNRLEIPDDPDEMPKLMVYGDRCRHFVRTIPSLCMDEILGIDDLEKHQEDHIYDDSALLCMARPIGADWDKIKSDHKKLQQEKRIKALDTASRAAAREVAGLNAQVLSANKQGMGIEEEWTEDNWMNQVVRD